MILDAPGACWRIETADQAAVFVDMADYFTAAKSAMSKATRSIHLLNWSFDADTLFDPQPGVVGPNSDRFGEFLKALAATDPKLDVRILCWNSALPVAATQNFFPARDRKCFRGSAVRFVLDGKLPIGACHHQKALVIDDAVAFCGGGDIAPDRWDTPLHLDNDPRRIVASSESKWFESRHEVMALVQGPAAAALGALFRDRWRRATGEDMAPAATADTTAWPSGVAAGFAGATVGLSRTAGAWRGWPEVRESLALTLASISVAKHCLYLENQYFTSPIVAEALAARLEEADGPEVILVSTRHSPSWFDQMTMDRTRSNFIRRLLASDLHGRLRIYAPVTAEGRDIIVHAKLSIVDDVLLRIGSSNMNNRSAGFDTECDLSIEAVGANAASLRAEIDSLRRRLLAHWLGCPVELVTRTMAAEGRVGAALDALAGQGLRRLTRLEPQPLGPLAAFIAAFHLVDPMLPSDSFRPLRRRAELLAESQALARRLDEPPAAGRASPSGGSETAAAPKT